MHVKFIIAAVVLPLALAAVPVADGQQCGPIRRVVIPQRAPVRLQPVIAVTAPVAVVETVAAATVFNPIAVTTPAYSVGYNGQQGYSGGLSAEQTQALIRELQELRLAIESLKGGVTVNGNTLSKGQQLLTQNCIGCHGEQVAAAKAKGKILFKQGRFDNTDENAAAVIEQIRLNRMPPGKKLDGDTKFEITYDLTVASAPPPAVQPQQSPQPPPTPVMPPAVLPPPSDVKKGDGEQG